MAQELDMEQPTTPDTSDTPASADTPDGEEQRVLTWQEGIQETAAELEAISPPGPDTIQLSIMEYVFLWITPFPDEFWTKVIGVTIVWCVPSLRHSRIDNDIDLRHSAVTTLSRPPSRVHEWFVFRRDIAVRTAKQKRELHPFRKPQEVVPVEVEGRTLVDMRCIALGDGKPWTDTRFTRIVNHRFDAITEKWNERMSRMEYEAKLMAEYREQTTRADSRVEY
ncbi:hypothetical protein EVJ58_g8799 [Rhodofomes roseus]|uniref:Uncharacterized protein n=1 Tax=Rhodofomes roseus TaxID=34475 RepID=A0A4Y9XZI5_9APHY|nr:hypothetical protein EVJ58_g8799 [Rhodofomes roseus]